MSMQKVHISQRGASSGPGKDKAAGWVLSGFDDSPRWEMCDFYTGMGSIPWPVRKTKSTLRKSCISTHPVSAWIVSRSWNKGWGWRLLLQCCSFWDFFLFTDICSLNPIDYRLSFSCLSNIIILLLTVCGERFRDFHLIFSEGNHSVASFYLIHV